MGVNVSVGTSVGEGDAVEVSVGKSVGEAEAGWNGVGGGLAVPVGSNTTEALFTHAAKLPRIDLQRPPSVIGRNTVHAMQAGLLFGYVSMVEGMVERFRKELGLAMKVIATGGLAPIIAQETDVIQIIAPWLTLDGLRILWDLNHPL